MDADATAPSAADAAETLSVPDDFATVLRGAIAASGLSLEEVRQRLAGHGVAVSIATLSYWQSGRSRPERASSLSAMGPLEEVLGVSRGELVGRLRFGGPSRRPRPAPAPPPRARTWPAADEAIARLGLDLDSLRRRSVHDRIELGPGGERRRHTVRMVLTAEHDRVESYPIWAEYASGGATPPSVRGLVNARVGRTVELVDHRGIAAEMVFPAPLARGQSIVVEHELGLDDDTPWTGWARHVPDTMREAVIEVSFDPARLPAEAEQVFEAAGPGEDDAAGAVGGDPGPTGETVTPLEPTTPLTIVVTEADPGIHGLRWRW